MLGGDIDCRLSRRGGKLGLASSAWKKHRVYDGFSRPSQGWWKLGNATWWFHDVFEHILARNRCFPSFPVRFGIYFLALRLLAGSVSRWMAFVFFVSSVAWRVGCLAGISIGACPDVAVGLVCGAWHDKASYIRWFFASEPEVVGVGQRDLVVLRRV
jgi:hypothetical protein